MKRTFLAGALAGALGFGAFLVSTNMASDDVVAALPDMGKQDVKTVATKLVALDGWLTTQMGASWTGADLALKGTVYDLAASIYVSQQHHHSPEGGGI